MIDRASHMNPINPLFQTVKRLWERFLFCFLQESSQFRSIASSFWLWRRWKRKKFKWSQQRFRNDSPNVPFANCQLERQSIRDHPWRWRGRRKGWWRQRWQFWIADHHSLETKGSPSHWCLQLPPRAVISTGGGVLCSHAILFTWTGWS